MTVFRFESPFVLLTLIPVVAVCLVAARRKRPAVLYSSVEGLRQLPRTNRQRFRSLLPWIQTVGLCLIAVALARPQLGKEETRIRTEGIAIQMCIDRSGSMQAMDFPVDGEQVDRLSAVKHVFRKFVQGDGSFSGRKDDLIGLVAFGGFATALCPATLDHGALLEVLSTVEIPKPIEDERGRIINEHLLREEQATAIGDALALAVDRLKDSTARSRIVVLLSDGENTAGVVEPADAANAAAEFGIKVYCIGVGSNGVAPFPAVDRTGKVVLVPQAVRLDEETLRRIAEISGGQYFNAKNTDSLQRVYEQIDDLEKTEIEGRLYTDYREVFVWPMTVGLSCLLFCIVLGNTWLRGLP